MPKPKRRPRVAVEPDPIRVGWWVTCDACRDGLSIHVVDQAARKRRARRLARRHRRSYHRAAHLPWEVR
jgi:hypothetical protein